ADLQQAAQGHLVRPRAAAPLPDRKAVPDGGAAAARAAAEDAARGRGARARALSGARSLEDREARARGLDAATPRPAHAAEAIHRGVAGDQRGPESAPAARAPRDSARGGAGRRDATRARARDRGEFDSRVLDRAHDRGGGAFGRWILLDRILLG